MKQAIVTGATGFLGTHLLEALSRHGIQSHALCREGMEDTTRIETISGVSIVWYDSEQLPQRLEGIQGDILYHLAWENASGQLRQNPAPQLANVERLISYVQLAKETGCKKIVGAGTVSEETWQKIDALEGFHPAAYYLLCKRYGYSLLRQLAAEKGMELVWLTFCHPIGRYNKTNQLVAQTIEKLLTGQPTQFGSGENWFDVIGAKDLAEAFFLAGEKSILPGRYYVGSGQPQTVRACLERVRELVGVGGALHFNPDRADALALEREWLDWEPFRQATGFYPQISFDQAVQETIAWVQENLTMEQREMQQHAESNDRAAKK